MNPVLSKILPVLILPWILAHCSSQGGQPRGQGSTAYLQTPSQRPVSYQPGAAPVQPIPYPFGTPQNSSPMAGGPRHAPPAGYLPFTGPPNVAPQAPYIRAECYILVNPRTGYVLAARNADTLHGAASTQKLLTALIVAEAGNLDGPVRIAASDIAVEPTKLGVRPGEVYSRRDLLIAFLVKSSNDVANALARDNAGSIPAFAAKMNARARALGATNSSFKNPHGLTAPGQYSTARDLARIAAVAYRNPVIRDAVRRRDYTFRYHNGRVVSLKNTNDLLTRMAECDGMKTGYTNAAGRCLISSARRGGTEVILVQLGTKTTYIWDDGAKLMHWGFSR